MRLSNNLLRVHIAGFEKAVMALRAAPSHSRLHEEIAALFAQNVSAAGDDALALVVRAAMQQIAAAVPDLPAQQASKYQNWLLTRYRQNWANQVLSSAPSPQDSSAPSPRGANPPQPLLLEDLSKYADDLTHYHNTPNIIKKRAGISTDLFAIDSPFELYQQLKALRGEVATEFKVLSPSQQSFIDNNEAIIIGQTAQWRLVMPLTTEASQEFGAGTRWCTAAQNGNRFNEYFPDNALLYLEASGIGKHAFVLKDGKITRLFNAEDTQQTPEQQQALFDKLPTLAAQLQKLDATTSLLQPIIDKADFATTFDLTITSRHLAPRAAINEATLVEGVNSGNLTQADKDNYFVKAAKGGLSNTVDALLKLGANVHADNDYALRWAARNGHTDVVRLLLEHGANVHADDDGALRMAAPNGHTDVAALLLKHGANVHANNNKALRLSVDYDRTDVLALLLKHGADAQADNDYALRWVANSGHIETVRLLLKHGANIHAYYDAALRSAAEKGYTDVVKLLLDHGADVHASNDNALRLAAEKGHTGVVKLLLNHGANVHAYYDAALPSAAEKGHTDVVKLLLDHGANVHADNDYAITRAAMNGHTDVVKILEAHIAKEKTPTTTPRPQSPAQAPKP